MKKVLTIIVIIVALPFIVALFVKKDYAVSREITIDKPASTVFDYLKYLKNQDEFSKWASMDPDMKKSYRGTDGTVGFVSAWESEKDDVGVGEQEITAIVEGERLEYELRFIKPWESVSPAYITTIPTSDTQTKVTWAFEGKMDYPMNLMMLFMDMEQMIGTDLEIGLGNLKSILEAMPDTEKADDEDGEDGVTEEDVEESAEN